MSPPLVVVEDEATETGAAAELAGAGWRLVAAATGGDVVRLTVATPEQAVEALRLALRGSGLLVHATGPRELVDDLVDDLGRLGPVRHRGPGQPVLQADTWALLHALAQGRTVTAAAKTVHLSARTAERRVADAQRTLGVASRGALLAALLAPERIPKA